VDFKTVDEGEQSEFYGAYQTITRYRRSSYRSFIHRYIREWLQLTSVLNAKKARDTLRFMPLKIAEKRRNAPEENSGKCLLDMMLEATPPFDVKYIQTNSFLFFLAGHETTAAAICWALYLLSLHEDVQTRVREEVDIVLKGNHVNAENMNDLIYLDMFIKEVLRYGSPISQVSSRSTSEDIQIDKYIIPKNTTIGLGIHAIHHNPEFWPNPEKFDPERFDPKRISKQHPFAFLPFSLGKRICIGNNFSLMEQKVFLSMLLQRYVITSSTDSAPFKLDPRTIAHAPLEVSIILTKRNT